MEEQEGVGNSGISSQVCEVMVGDEVQFSQCIVVCEGKAGELLGEDLSGVRALPHHGA